MRCYYHKDKEAVGTCKSCGKGLCRDCAVDLGKGLACRGRCEPDAQAVIQLVDRNIQLSRFGCAEHPGALPPLEARDSQEPAMRLGVGRGAE